MVDVFKGSFTQQEPIPEAGIEAAVAVMRHGRLHRYNTVEGETAQTVQAWARNIALLWRRVAMLWRRPCALWGLRQATVS